MESQSETVAQFQRRRLWSYNLSLCNAFLLLLAATLALLMSVEAYLRLGQYLINFMLVLMVVMFGSLTLTLVTIWLYRCPACQAGLFGDLDPNFCRKCGVTLRESHDTQTYGTK